MKSIIKKIFFTLFALCSISMAAQTGNLQPSEEHIEQGRIRIKIKQEFLLQNIVAKGLDVNNTQTKVLGITSIDNVGNNVGITRIKRVFPFSLKDEEKHRKYGLHQWYELEFDASINPDFVVEQYSDLAEVQLAKPVYKKINLALVGDPIKVIVSKLNAKNGQKTSLRNKTAELYGKGADFNDPLLEGQWHYNNDGTVGTEGMDIDLFKAWTITTGKKEVIVAIVDGGIDVEHEDLAANIWVNEAELNGEKGVDDDQNGYVDDINGANFVFGGALTPHTHGTHVAGTVGAVSNNGIGVAGVAGGDGTGNGIRLMSCQVFDDRAVLSGNFAAGIVYGADNGAVISQNSWGYSQSGYYEPEVLDAIRYFKAEAGQYEGSPMKGGILFFAAGNDGAEQEHYPGAFDEVIAVTSVGPTGLPAGYTNTGDWTDIAAPGGDQGSFGQKGGVLSTFPDNEYGYYQGTSMACPHVSGVAALVISKFGEDGLTPDELKSILLNSTDQFVFNHNGKYGSGTLNATYALADDEKKAPYAINDLEALEIFHNAVELGWEVPEDEDNFQPSYFYLAFSEKEITSSNFDQATIFTFTNPFDAGTQVSVDFSGLNKQKEYWFAIKSADQFNNISSISNIIKVTTTDEPHFISSTNSVDVTIDVTDTPIYTENVEFSNIGEGNIVWENYILNEKYYWEEQAKIAGKLADKIKVSALQQTAETQTSAVPGFKLLTKEQASKVETKPSFWEYDNTETYAGLSYEDGSPARTVLGPTMHNLGLIHATRFFVGHTFTFNLTHVELAMYPMLSDEPIIIEIKKGSTNVEEAKTVHLQEYYPDTTKVFKYYRIPLYKPQRFEDGETFWVVFHHPEKDNYPLGVFIGPRHVDHFMMSDNNGQSFYDYQTKYVPNYYVPLIRALSSGDDGSYVFIEPGSGKIASGETNDVAFNIDATSLSNGKHLASVNVITNDANKPILNIEVKVNVVGQQPALDLSEIRKFEVIQDRLNELELKLENVGLSKLEIYKVKSVNSGIIDVLTDTITIFQDFKGVVPFQFQTSNSGLIDLTIELETNIGDISLPATMQTKEFGVYSAVVDINNITLQHNEQKTVELTLTNQSSTTILEYDFEYDEVLKARRKIFVEGFSYNIVTSDDANGPVANQWEDLSEFGFSARKDLDSLSLTMEFPFYTETFNQSFAGYYGQIYFRQQSYTGGDFPNDKFGQNFIAPLQFVDYFPRVENILFYDFGDRAVYTLDFKENQFSKFEGDYSCQIVLYRDGTIEFRYKNVDVISDDINYIVAIQGFENNIYDAFKGVDDTEKRVHNGMVIRFEPSHDVQMFTGTSVKEGVLPVGASEKIEVTIDPAVFEIVEGTYENFIFLNTNSASGKEKIPVTINVKGTPDFETTDTLNFTKQAEGFTNVQIATVNNIGYATGDITSITFSGSNYTVTEPFPITVLPRANIFVPINFQPTAKGIFNETMTLRFSNGQTEVVVLNGEGKINSEFTHTIPTNIDVTLNGGEVVEIPFSITTTADSSDLEYTYINSTHAKAGTANERRAEHGNDENFRDDFGYIWKLSGADKIFYKWEDIKETGTSHKIEFEKQKGFKLNFTFPFYGKTYDSIWVSKNGYITVVKPTKDAYSTIPLDFAKDDGMAGMIAPLWAPLVSSDENGGVLVLSDEDRVIIQWDEFIGESANSSGGSTSFQVEILKDGAINFNYKSINNYGGLLKYGLESPDESEVLDEVKAYILPWSFLSDSLTVAIAPPLKGLVKKGETKNFNLELSAKNIFKPGVVLDTVVLTSTSYSTPEIKIPVTLHVNEGFAAMQGPENLTWNEVVYNEGNTTLTQEMKLSNIGFETVIISEILSANLDGVTFYDANDELIVKNSTGELSKNITIVPWGEYIIKVVIDVESFQNVTGTITLNGNISPFNINVNATIVESPVFDWDAVDQEFVLNNSEVATYTFNIENKGVSTLKYDLIPTVIEKTDTVKSDSIVIKEIGKISFEAPIIIDQLTLDKRDYADGVFAPNVGGVFLAFSNRFIAPEGGFFMTHLNFYTYLGDIGQQVQFRVYKGAESPNDSKVIYQENFLIEKEVDKQWVNFQLKIPVFIEEGEIFHVVVCPPLDYQYLGFDVSNDPDLLEACQGGTYRGNGVYTFYTNKYNQMNMVWKIRPVMAAGGSQWLQLDSFTGELISGESKSITASVNSEEAGPGEHFGKVIVLSNDVNRSQDDFDVHVIVNGAPKFDFTPNQYTDTLKITELENLIVNFKASDVENETLTYSFTHLENEPEVKFTQVDNEIAQLEINSDYESAGIYKWDVTVSDTAGNETINTVLVEVIDKNRAPVLNPAFEIIELNIADPNEVFVINPRDLFTDPDGDALQILAGNYTPDIVDLALGSTYIDIHPLQEGVGFLVFGADDGKEGGFAIYGVYVVINNDPSAVPDGSGFDDNDIDGMSVRPNPVVDGNANVNFMLDKAAVVTIEIYDMSGRPVAVQNVPNTTLGRNNQNLNVSNLNTGVYICKISVNGQFFASKKILIN